MRVKGEGLIIQEWPKTAADRDAGYVDREHVAIGSVRHHGSSPVHRTFKIGNVALTSHPHTAGGGREPQRTSTASYRGIGLPSADSALYRPSRLIPACRAIWLKLRLSPPVSSRPGCVKLWQRAARRRL